MTSSLVTRNVRIGKRRTSVRLEEPLWAALDDIVKSEGVTMHELCTCIASERNSNEKVGGFTSALRVYVVKYLRECAERMNHNSIVGKDAHPRIQKHESLNA
jgi:predicted DNA-binding ribbon-helix-helix protein